MWDFFEIFFGVKSEIPKFWDSFSGSKPKIPRLILVTQITFGTSLSFDDFSFDKIGDVTPSKKNSVVDILWNGNQEPVFLLAEEQGIGVYTEIGIEQMKKLRDGKPVFSVRLRYDLILRLGLFF